MKTILHGFCLLVALVTCLGGISSARAQGNGTSTAVSLDGVNNYIKVPAGIWFSNNFTIEGWVYVRSYNNWSRLLDFGNGENNYNTYLALTFGTSGQPVMGVFALNGTPTVLAASALPTNQWVHLAATASGTTGTIYVNGAVVATGTLNVAGNVTRTNNYFGRSNYAADSYANAIFDEIRIWNVARSQSDIQTYRDSRLMGNEPGLIGYWRFDEGTGTVATNSAAANSAQLINGPTWVTSTIASADTLSATAITTNAAALNGTVCPGGFATAGWFEWGTSASYGQASGIIPVGNGSVFTNFSFAATGLAVATTYHFRAVATNSVGTQYGPDQSFTTAATAPVVTTGIAYNITVNSAVLSGTFNLYGVDSTIWFEWGLTTNYDHATTHIPTGIISGSFEDDESINGLSPATMYHYRAAASNSLGIVYGVDTNFTTSLPPAFAASVNLPTATSFFVLGASVTAWGDYDNDGFLDVVQIGSPTGPTSGIIPTPTPRTYLFHNNAGNGFTDVTDTVAPGLTGSGGTYGTWIDFNNDGRLDLLICGTTAQVWLNTTNGFINASNIAVPNLPANSRVAVTDYDNDGRPDILVAGSSSRIWHNTVTGFVDVTATVAPALSGFNGSSGAWGDYDRDGRLDFLIAGPSGSQIWRNTGNGFTNVTSAVAPGLASVTPEAVAWGDLNNDGGLDFVLASDTGGPTQIWLNSGSGFTNVPAWVPVGVALGAAISLGDFDSDGRLDILGAASQLWHNTGNGFVSIGSQIAPNLPYMVYNSTFNLAPPSVSFGDYNNDGRLDMLLSGVYSPDVAQIWKSFTAQTNTPPQPPAGLTTVFNGQSVTLHWNPGSDANTPIAELTYNLRLGTTPGGSDIIGPLAGTDGQRRLPAMGNRQQVQSFPVNNITVGQRYYWAVQTVDSAYAGSPFATGDFALGALPLPPGGVLIPGDMNGDGIVSPEEFAAVLANVNSNGILTQANVEQVLSNYWPHTSMEMTNVLGLGGTNVSFLLPDSPVIGLNVEYSTNLTDWQLIGPAELRYGFLDTNAPATPKRFYRLRSP
jgi:hypothetical protein